MLKHMLPPLFSALASAPSCIITHAPRGLRPRGPPSSFAAISFTTTKMSTESYTFGPYKIRPEEVFYSTQLSYALVNLRPVVPGSHGAALYSGVNFPLSGTCLWLLWIKREVKRFVDLSADEITDLWLTAQKVGSQLEHYHRASSLTFTIQDGPQAGQTVPHVHIHILPRKVGDFERNDEIYDAIDEKEKDLTKKLDLDKERTNRSLEEMSLEADEYRKLF